MNKKFFLFFIFLLSNNFGENEVTKAFAREIGNLVPFVYICYRIINGITSEKSDLEKFYEKAENKLKEKEKHKEEIIDKEIQKIAKDYIKGIKETKKKYSYSVKFMNFMGKAFAATILGSILYYKVGGHKINSLVKETLIEKWT